MSNQRAKAPYWRVVIPSSDQDNFETERNSNKYSGTKDKIDTILGQSPVDKMTF